MRILIVCDLLATFVRFRLPLAETMVNQGHVVQVVCSRSDLQSQSVVLDRNIEVKVIPMERTRINPLSDFVYYRKLLGEMRSFQPDLLFAYQAKAAAYSSLAASRLPGCSRHILFPGLGYLFADSPSFAKRVIRSLAVNLYRLGFRNIETAFFQNHDDVRTLQHFKVLSPSTRIVVVNGSGVSTSEYAYSAAPTNPIRFIMATRLLKAKGIYEYAEAAKQIRQRYGDKVVFDLLGSVDTNPSALALDEVMRWHAEGRLMYHGHVGDVRPFLERSSVFVLPTYYMEGTPRSILEAMSIGRAVITTDTRGCREAVIDGTNGILVMPRNVDSLVNAMVRLIENPHLIQQFGRNSRTIAEERYEVRDVVESMLDAMNVNFCRAENTYTVDSTPLAKT